MSAPRILIVSHGHPELSLGGGEIAAYDEYREMRQRGIEAMFVARCAAPSGHAGTSFTARTADGREVLYHAPPVDHFRHSQPQRRAVYEDFAQLLQQFQPTAVHFHHYVHLGLELLRETRRYAPRVQMVLTLHDYLGMCNAQGQMRKTNGNLCQRATPLDCNACFPERSPQDFFLRELFVKSFFDLVDHFVSPSRFLADRYIAWGLPAHKVHVVENGQAQIPAPDPLPAFQAAIPQDSDSEASAAAQDKRLHYFVVLGQLSALKGTPLLFDAVRALPKALRKKIRIEIHGSLQHAQPEFKAQFELAMAELGPTLRYCGAYRPADVHGILQRAGWLIVPSIWWENSPLVIQEAFNAGRPILCSNIGGMAEKIAHGKNGLHFQVGSSTDLAMRMEEAVQTPGLWQQLCAGITPPPRIDATVDQILRLLCEQPVTAEAVE